MGLSAIIPLLMDADAHYSSLISSNTQLPQQLKVKLSHLIFLFLLCYPLH